MSPFFDGTNYTIFFRLWEALPLRPIIFFFLCACFRANFLPEEHILKEPSGNKGQYGRIFRAAGDAAARACPPGRRRLQPPEGECLLFPAGNTSAKEETEMKESVSGDLDDFIFQDSWIISQR